MSHMTVIHPDPIISQDACDRFGEALDAAIGEGADVIIVDCCDVQYMNSRGIGKLIETYMQLADRGGTLRIVQPADFLQRGFESVGISSFLEIFPSMKEATAE